MKNILITGGCGYIGSELVRRLAQGTDDNITIIDKLYFGKESIQDLLCDKVKLFRLDIRNLEKHPAFKNIDIVIHLAGLSNDATSDLNPEATHEINVIGTKNVLQNCVTYKVKKLIFASTSSIYGYSPEVIDENGKIAPISTYAKSKLEAENLIKSYSDKIDDISILRFATLFGYSHRFRTDLVVNTMIKDAMVKGELIMHGSGNQHRPLIHIKDLVNILDLIIHSDKERCEIYNVTSFSITVALLADWIVKDFKRFYKKDIAINQILLNTIADKRDYNVSNTKLLKEFDYKFKYTVTDTIREINEARLDNLEDIKYNNLLWMKFLLRAKSYIQNIKGKIL